MFVKRVDIFFNLLIRVHTTMNHVFASYNQCLYFYVV